MIRLGVLDVLLVAGFWFGVILSLLTTVKMWRTDDRSDWSYMKPNYWLWSEAGWRAYRRATTPGLGVITCFAIGLTYPPIGPYCWMAGFFGALPLCITVALFNRPKWLVPPPLRGERGVLAERRAASH